MSCQSRGRGTTAGVKANGLKAEPRGQTRRRVKAGANAIAVFSTRFSNRQTRATASAKPGESPPREAAGHATCASPQPPCGRDSGHVSPSPSFMQIKDAAPALESDLPTRCDNAPGWPGPSTSTSASSDLPATPAQLPRDGAATALQSLMFAAARRQTLACPHGRVGGD